MGIINGQILMGVDFLALLAHKYGVSLDFYPPDTLGNPEPSQKGSSKLRAKRFQKCDRRHRDSANFATHLRKRPSALEDLSDMIGDLPWIRTQGSCDGIFSIRGGIRSLLLSSEHQHGHFPHQTTSFEVDTCMVTGSPS